MERIKKAVELLDNKRVESLLKDSNSTQFFIHGTYGDYLVTCSKNGAWFCTCDDYTHRHAVCKHIIASILMVGEEFRDG